MGGKKKGGSKAEKALKREAKALRQDAKVKKQAKKRAGKERLSTGMNPDEDDIDALLAEQCLKDAARTAVTITVVPRPGPRTNFSMTTLPGTNVVGGEMFLFGGEYHDGVDTVCYNDCLRWNLASNEWRQIESLNTPPPRCSHQAVAYRDHVYVFGGEFATTDQFHHYRDLWRMDLRTNTWEEVEATGKGPSARSGHRAAVWRNYMVVFGGFHDALRDTKWFNDIYFFSFADRVWHKIELPSTTPVPSPRSGCQLALYDASNTVFIYGGYSRVKTAAAEQQTGAGGKKSKGGSSKQQKQQQAKAEGKIHTDMWAIHLHAPRAGASSNAPTCTFERVSRKGAAPSVRVGASMAVYTTRRAIGTP